MYESFGPTEKIKNIGGGSAGDPKRQGGCFACERLHRFCEKTKGGRGTLRYFGKSNVQNTMYVEV